MKIPCIGIALLVLAGVAGCAAPASQSPAAPAAPGAGPPAASSIALDFRGGRWYDGAGFIEREMFVVGGRFSTAKPARVDRVVDLAGGYVVPPFAEGHNHWL